MYITMDRCARLHRSGTLRRTEFMLVSRSYEADWAMVQRGWAAHVLGRAEHTFTECVCSATAGHAMRR